MPLKSGELTVIERKFIESYARHNDRARAERDSGVPQYGGYQILARPEIQRRIIAEQTARLSCEALPVAIATLIEIMQNKKAPAAARVQAAKVTLDRAMPQTDGGQHKEIHEMTAEEIAQAINTLEAQAAAAAKPVGGNVLD